uniref:Uncharacterized protein n=1 Tax=Anguilla anguilla TaxID=7936 RepID=A0A0E9PZR3_ANGAN
MVQRGFQCLPPAHVTKGPGVFVASAAGYSQKVKVQGGKLSKCQRSLQIKYLLY